MDRRRLLARSRAAGWTPIRAVSLLVVLATARGQALAQGVDPDRAFRTTAQGISAGKFLLFPSITVEAGYDDNVFYQSESVPGTELVSSGRLVLAPKIMVDLPLSRSRTRLAYTLQYRDYSSEEFVQANHLSHFFDFDAWVRMGDNLTLALREHYVEGTQEVQQFDPGGEVRFGLVPFTLSEPTVEVKMAFGGRHQVALLPRLSTLNFDDKFAAGFYDYERRGLTGRYQYQVDPVTAAFASYYREKTDQDRTTSYFGDIDVDTRYIGAGLQRSFGGTIASSVSAGYETQDYEGGFGENFSGLVCDINLAWTAADVYRFELLASRQPYQSFFVNSNYYLSNMIRVRVAQQLGRSAYWVAGLALQRNPYADPVDIRDPDPPSDSDLDGDGFIDVYETLLPSQGKLRRDGAFIVELAAGMRLSPSLRLTLGYNHEARDSNIEQSFDASSVFEPFDYTVDRVFLRIEAGIL